MKKRRLKYVWCAWIAGLIVACTNEHNFAGIIPEAGKVDVVVSVGLTPSSTDYLRAGSVASHSDIKNVDALVFDKDDKFLERIKVDNSTLNTGNTSASFNIKLDVTPEKRTIHLVMNGRSPDDDSDRLNFNDLTPGMPMIAAMESLKTNDLMLSNPNETFTEKVLPIIMWGVFKLDNGVSAATKVTGVKLLRTMATFEINWPLSGSGVLEGAYLPKAASEGYLVPFGWENGVTANAVSMPREVSGYISPSYEKIPFIEENNLFLAFSYERYCNTIDFQYIILKVDHSSNSQFGQGVGFYKVAVADGVGNSMLIIRNHRYKVMVENVNGPGYPDINTAIESAPSNDLKIKIMDDNDQYPIVISGGEFSMALSNNDVCIFGGFKEWDYALGKFTDKDLPLEDVELCRMVTTKPITSQWRVNIKQPSEIFKVESISTELLSSSSNRYEYIIKADIIPTNTGNTNSEQTGICTLGMAYEDLYYDLNVIWKKKEYGRTEFDIDPTPSWPDGYKSSISDNVDLFWTMANDPDAIVFSKNNWNIRVLDVVSDPNIDGGYPWMTLSKKKLSDWGYGIRNYIMELTSKTSGSAYVCSQTCLGTPDQLPGYDYYEDIAIIMISGHLENSNEPYNRKVIYCRTFPYHILEQP